MPRLPPLLRRLALLLVLAAALPSPARAQGEDGASETSIKATYVLNFLRYTQWPAERAPQDDSDAFEVAVVGSPQFASALRSISQQAAALGQRPVRVRRLGSGTLDGDRLQRTIEESHAVFIAAGVEADADVAQALARMSGAPVLTIGDGEGFAAIGGMLGLVNNGRRIVFDANPNAIRDSGLQVSAKVMKLARLIEPTP